MTMRNLIFPLLLLAGIGVAFNQMMQDEAPTKELTVAMSANPEISPYLLSAAQDLGHKRVRAYDGGVFIDDGEESIAFYKTKTGMEMHVSFETEYRRAHSERESALQALKVKGESIFAHAQSLQARDKAEGAVAARERAAPTDG